MTSTQQPIALNDRKLLSRIHELRETEGWDIYHAGEMGLRIEEDPDMNNFKDAEEAKRFVIKKANEGSELHSKTIGFICKYANTEELEEMIIQRKIVDRQTIMDGLFSDLFTYREWMEEMINHWLDTKPVEEKYWKDWFNGKEVK